MGVNLAKSIIGLTPYEIRRPPPKLPEISLAPLELLLAYYTSRGQSVNVVQVGACDGVTYDPVHDFVRKGLGRAVLIEPNPYAFARLQKTYAGFANVRLIQAAIAEADGKASLYRAKRTDEAATADPHLQIASFDQAHLLKFGLAASEIESITVPCRSLASLVAELGFDRIDLLQIDAEGYDGHIVRMALKMPFLPDGINFEHHHLSAEERAPLYSLLTEADYLLAYDTSNILALRKSVLNGGQMSQAPSS